MKNLAYEVVKVIKETENTDTRLIQNKCVVISAVKEKVLPIKPRREREEKKVAWETVKPVQYKNSELEEETEKVYKLGRHDKG